MFIYFLKLLANENYNHQKNVFTYVISIVVIVFQDDCICKDINVAHGCVLWGDSINMNKIIKTVANDQNQNRYENIFSAMMRRQRRDCVCRLREPARV